jgi:hypothetical protein
MNRHWLRRTSLTEIAIPRVSNRRVEKWGSLRVELLSKTMGRLAAAFEWLRPRPNSAEADLDASG